MKNGVSTVSFSYFAVVEAEAEAEATCQNKKKVGKSFLKHWKNLERNFLTVRLLPTSTSASSPFGNHVHLSTNFHSTKCSKSPHFWPFSNWSMGQVKINLKMIKINLKLIKISLDLVKIDQNVIRNYQKNDQNWPKIDQN